MYKEFLLSFSAVVVGTGIMAATAWWLLPRRRHFGAALLEVLGVSLGLASRELVFGWFPHSADNPLRLLVTAALGVAFLFPAMHFANVIRERAARNA